jgi:hypothetical protein
MAMQAVDHLIELWRFEQPRHRRRPGCSGPRYCDRPLRRWARQTAASDRVLRAPQDKMLGHESVRDIR